MQPLPKVNGRRLDQVFGPASQSETGTVAERIAKVRQERVAKAAFAEKLTTAPKRRK